MTDATLQFAVLALWAVALIGSVAVALLGKDDWHKMLGAISLTVIVWSFPKLTMVVWP